MNYKYKLSVIIPTYNGSAWIEDGIRSVISQIQGLTEVEFIVRDNASTDSTSELIKRFQTEFPEMIKYDRREELAEDADQNFHEAIEISSGKYVLVLGDDDLLMPTFIQYVLSLIDKYSDIGLFYFNRIATSLDYKGASILMQDPSPEFVKIYDDSDNFVKAHIIGPGFISVNVVKRECYNKGVKYSNPKYYGFEYYARMLFGIRGYKIVYLFQPMILQRHPRVRGWDAKMALYGITGLSNLYKDYDSNNNGIYDTWVNRLNHNRERYIILSRIPSDRKLYKEKYSELAVYLNLWQRLLAYLLIHCKFFKYVYIMSLKTLGAVDNILKILLRPIRKS